MIQLIRAAALGVSKEERIVAENQIIQLRLEKTDSFFLEACLIFKNQQLASDIRQATGTIITMSISVEAPLALSKTPQKIYLWDKLQPQAKQNVKDAVLSVLIDQDRNIRRAAANIVAAICCIEIPRNEWEGIVEKISSNINNEDPLIKEVSILTLGFICERLKEKKSFVLNEHLQELVLTGILLGLKQSSKQIIETALKALRDGLGSMPDILNKPQYRDYLINQTVEIINKEEYRNFGLQILNDFTRVCYHHLDSYMNGFVTLLQPIIKNTTDEENCIQAIEFWEELAGEYKFRSDLETNPRNYISGEVGVKVVTWLLEALCAIQTDKDDNQDNGVDDAAAKCLETIFEEDSQQFEKLVLDFTTNTIDHANPKFRQASIRAFASFLIGADEKRKQELVDASLVKLVSLLNDESKIVQYSAIKSISLITEECAQSFLHHANFLDILKVVVGKLSVSANFLNHACKIIDNLCQVCIQTGENYFTNLADDLIQVLFGTCLTADSTLHTINCCICTIMNLITACHNPDVCRKEIEFVLTHFGSISQLDSERRQKLYSSFFTLLQTALLALRRQNIPMETLTTIYDLVIKHFSNIKKVDSDGLYVIGSLSFYFRNEPRLIEDFWKYIEYSLTQYNQSFTFKAGLSCVCDFAANYGPDLGDKVPLLIKHLIDSFQNQQVTRQSKLDVIMSIGEMFLNCGQMCLPFLDQVMNILIIACQASIEIDSTDKNYAENLRDHIIQTLTCILHGTNEDDSKPCQELLPYIENIFKFIEYTTNKSLQPKINYLKSCILWMADLSRTYKVRVQHLVRQRWVFDCLEMLKKHNKNKSLDNVIQYAKEYF